MANVWFRVTRELPADADRAFAALVDWRDHATWVPMTRVEVTSGDGGAGTVFVARTGLGPAALVDRMRVDALDPQARTVDITKIGPVLSGTVRLEVTPAGTGRSRLEWVEDIRVPGVPQFLAPAVAAASRQGFQTAIGRLARLLASGAR